MTFNEILENVKKIDIEVETMLASDNILEEIDLQKIEFLTRKLSLLGILYRCRVLELSINIRGH